MNASTNTFRLSIVGITALAALSVGAFFVSTAHASSLQITTIGSGTYINANDVATSIQVVGTADAAGDDVTVTLTDGTHVATGSGTADGSGDFSVTIDGPSQLANLADGTITSSIDDTSSNDTGVTGPTVTKDTVAPPAPIIDTQPSDPSNSLSFTSTFEDTEAGATFQCALDADFFDPCDTGTFGGSTNAATHTARIQATDAAGNTAETDFSWTITVPPVTTIAATSITSTDAQLNGQVGPNDADSESFWVSLAPFATPAGGSPIPAGVDSTQVLPAVAANGTFSDPLSSVTTSGIPGNLEAMITPNTTYYYVAWAHTSAGWNPGAELQVTTAELPQTITFDPIADQTFGDPDVALSATSDSGLTVSYDITGDGCDASSTPDYVFLDGTGDCTVVASQDGDGTYQAATPVTREFTVNPRPITVTAVTDTKVYDGTTTSSVLPTITSGNIVQNTSEIFDTINGISQSFATNQAGSGITITPRIYINGGDGIDPDYDVTYVNATGDITPAPIEITADPQTKVYGDVDPALTYQITSGALISPDTLSGSLTREAGESVDNYGIEQGTLDNPNYDITFDSANFAVTPAPLTITANDASKTVGDTVTFVGTEFTTSPLQNGETVGSVTLTSAGADSSATVAGSPYSIVPSAATGGTFDPDNYDITYTNGTLTVNAAPVPPAPSGGGGGNGPVSGGGGGGGSAPVALPNNGGATTTPSTGSPTGQVLGASAYNFTVNFGIGTKDNDVTQLQLILIAAGDLKVTAPTGYFGQATFAAVKLYQSANGISPVSGYVGPKTRAVLNGGTIPTSADEQKSLMIQQLQQELQALMAQIAAFSTTTIK